MELAQTFGSPNVVMKVLSQPSSEQEADEQTLAVVGCGEGLDEGRGEGWDVGVLGCGDGWGVGCIVGCCDGRGMGACEGWLVGNGVGTKEG